MAEKCRRLSWAGHAAQVKENNSTYKILVDKSKLVTQETREKV
jgi:hypothetical protein